MYNEHIQDYYLYMASISWNSFLHNTYTRLWYLAVEDAFPGSIVRQYEARYEADTYLG